MRVFLTGGTGFVGSHVARLLAARGHEVHALMLEKDPNAERLAAVAHRPVYGDLLRPDSFDLARVRPEACVHLGWYANPKDYLSSRVNLDLLAASTNLATRLVDLGCRRIVAAGTCFEYDTSVGFLAENGPLAPRHLYSTCKRALGDILAELTKNTTTSLAWARLFFLYGPNESVGRLVPAVIDSLAAGRSALVTTGEQIRDFMHVADAAAALVHVLETDPLSGAVNVATGAPVTVRQVVETIARAMKAEERVEWGAIQPRAEDPPFICANVSRLKASGFRPTYTLATGIEDTIAWRTKG